MVPYLVEGKHQFVSFLSRVRFQQTLGLRCSSPRMQEATAPYSWKVHESLGFNDLQVFLPKYSHRSQSHTLSPFRAQALAQKTYRGLPWSLLQLCSPYNYKSVSFSPDIPAPAERRCSLYNAMEVFRFSKGPRINSRLARACHFLSFFPRIQRLLTKARQHLSPAKYHCPLMFKCHNHYRSQSFKLHQHRIPIHHNQFLAIHFITLWRLLILPQARDFCLPTLSANRVLITDNERSRSRIPYAACASCGHSPHSLSLGSPRKVRLSNQWCVLCVGYHGAGACRLPPRK